MKKYFKISLSILIIFIFVCNIFAESFDGFICDVETTGWTYLSACCHMGKATTTYKFETEEAEEQYGSLVSSAFDLWDSAGINCSYSASSTEGTIEIVQGLEYNGLSGADSLDSSGHVLTWTIQLSKSYLDDATKANTVKMKTIAHELGHVYGLGHVDNKYQIMYGVEFAFKEVKPADRVGMQVVSHIHSHTSDYSKTYEAINSTQHKAICSTCLMYKIENCSKFFVNKNSTQHEVKCSYCSLSTLENCSYTSIHSGNTHYAYFNCMCGNTEIMSWPCSGNPCIEPYSIQPEYETE